MSNNNTPGRPKKISDEKLKEMALAIKQKNRGRKITFQFLQDETGIGRQTWKRRIEKYINELNKPIILPNNATLDDVYFPNIEEIFERHNNDKTKIIYELYLFEQMFRQNYQELSSLKEKMISLEELTDIVEKQKEEIKFVEQKASHYEMLYKTLVITSSFSHIREEKGIKVNLVQFNSNPSHDTALEEKEFNKMFSVNQETTESSIQDLSTMFPDLFKED
ncbi:hypothetical protein [Bacillus sp. FJAT-29937]|uniref:hypothetical protein n=1 Tax=Bacillus sp. FJAT-29937 TaxID=1720553 RepID=UPI00082E0B5F|nr:hypothetical protein [Bacillus sp. FJAT-29937]